MILLAVVLLLAGCGQSEVDLELDAARDRVEVALADDVPPVLTAGGVGDDAWDAFDGALIAARGDGLLIARARDSSSREGEDGGAASMAAVVAIVGPDGGTCVAIRVAGDGTVRSVQVAGDPAENCAGAPLPL